MKDFLSGLLTAYVAIGAVVFGAFMAVLIGLGQMHWSVDAIPQALACLVTGALWPAVMFAELHDLQAMARFVASIGG